jgi:hypothetical protein
MERPQVVPWRIAGGWLEELGRSVPRVISGSGQKHYTIGERGRRKQILQFHGNCLLKEGENTKMSNIL